MQAQLEIPQHVLAILSGMEQAGNLLKPYPTQLERADYLALNEVLEALGGKWKRGKGHVFDCTPDELAEKLDAAITTGEYDNPKRAEYFPTPETIANKIAALARVSPGDAVLEPSAGRGALVDALERIAPGLNWTLIEPLEANVKALQAQGRAVHAVTFEEWLANNRGELFDAAVMNPPFQKACEHALAAWRVLKRAGGLVCVMPSSVRFREDKKYRTVRELFEEHGGILDLPPDSFKESGTRVNTCLCYATKL